MQEMGASVSEDELRELIAEVDINQNATIEEEEFLQVWNCSITTAYSKGIESVTSMAGVYTYTV